MANLTQLDFITETLLDWRSFKSEIKKKSKTVEMIRFEARAECFHARRKAQLDDGGGKILLGNKIGSGAVVLGADHVWVCWGLGLILCKLNPRLAQIRLGRPSAMWLFKCGSVSSCKYTDKLVLRDHFTKIKNRSRWLSNLRSGFGPRPISVGFVVKWRWDWPFSK
jgi:hypothetical protein